MNKFIAILSISFILIVLVTNVFAAIKPEIAAIISSYENGDINRCNTLLLNARPDNTDEKTIVFYYKAMLTYNTDSAKSNFQQLIDIAPKSIYAQKAYLELGSICLLDREYDKAMGFFNKVTDANITEKHYWIANTYYQKEDYTNAINSANQFLKLTSSSPKIEDAHYLIADAYIIMNQYNNAISTLKKLLPKPSLINDEQYFRYRLGYAYEMLGNKLEALSHYKQGYEKDRFSQLAYQIEDRLFEMKSRYGSTLDLSFLYPYSDSPLPDIVLAEQLKAAKLLEQENPDSTSVVKELKPQEIDPSNQTGMYLQAGRFSQQANAVKLCEKIIKLGLNANYYKSTQFKDISWVIIVGPYQTQLDAQTAKDKLSDNNIETFIIQR
jgi:tetratricopeptide (TPR) repeat protein